MTRSRDPIGSEVPMAATTHNVIVSRCQSFLSDEEPWWEAHCSCGWVADETTDQAAWDAFNNHKAGVARVV